MKLGDRLYEIRTQKNISIYSLSKISEVSENHIRNIENNTKQPTVKTLKALTDGLNITLAEFFNYDDESPVYLTKQEQLMLNYYRRLSADVANNIVELCKNITKTK